MRSAIRFIAGLARDFSLFWNVRAPAAITRAQVKRHRVMFLRGRHELESHTDLAANDDRIGSAICLVMRVAAVVCLTGLAAAAWSASGSPGLSLLGLLY